MKKELLALLMLWVSYAVNSQDVANTLVVRLLSGETNTFLLEERPQLTFDNTDLVITTSKYETRYALTEVGRYFFKYDPTGIDEREYTSHQTISQEGNVVIIKGLNANHTVDVFTPVGVKLATFHPNEKGCVTLSLDVFPRGIYIIKYGERTTKIRRL